MQKILLMVFVGILGLLALVIVVSFLGNLKFKKSVDKEVTQFFSGVENKGDIIQKADLEGLPPVVQKWLEQSRVLGRERIAAVRLRQKVAMRTKEGGPWMPAVAEQYFRVDEPGFIWKVRAGTAPLFYFTGRDKYEDGRGSMLIKVLSLIKVADARGKEIDQGAMLRYLAETVWFPSAALSSYIRWEEVDAGSARATMTWGGVSASGVFTFNQEGDVVNFTALRYGDFNGRYLMKTWVVKMKDHQEFNGIRIPAAGEVIWKLDPGDYDWYRFELEDIEYNKPAVY